jgi:hypothetical protein
MKEKWIERKLIFLVFFHFQMDNIGGYFQNLSNNNHLI